MKKIIATVIIVLAVMFTPQGVYADSEEQNNEYYDRLISEINEGLSFEGDEDVKTVLEDNNITLEDPSSAANINAFDVIKHIFESFTAALRSPLIMLGKITAATMLCVLVRSMSAEGTTAESVRAFQSIFNLPVSGIVDFPTWYKISQIYVGVSKIGENIR